MPAGCVALIRHLKVIASVLPESMPARTVKTGFAVLLELMVTAEVGEPPIFADTRLS